MTEIKLEKRYPHSRTEDITDAFMRGYEQGKADRPQGEWKAKSFHECFCDNCGFTFDIMKCDFIENMKFCPNCGADMRGESDD